MRTSTNVNDGAVSLVDYALRWHRFGGGPAADIDRTFAVAPSLFFREVERTLVDDADRDLPAGLVLDMLRVCRLRIWLGD